MRLRLALFKQGACLLAPLLLVGCLGLKPTSDPTRHFVLTATEQGGGDNRQESGGVSLGISPVTLPAYSTSPWIALRTSENEIHYSDFYRWAEPVDQGVRRVIGLNLSSLLKTDRVQIEPWNRTAVDLQLSIVFSQFYLATNGTVSLTAHWQASDPESDEMVLAGQHHVVKEHSSAIEDPTEAVAALSVALGELSREIAKSIKSTN